MLNGSDIEDEQSDDENEMPNLNKKKSDSSEDESSYSEDEVNDEENPSGIESGGDDITDSSSEEVTDSEEYESEDEESEEEIISQSSQISSRSKNISSNIVESDSSDNGYSPLKEVCAICLSRMKREIGSPELCDHSFCLECILEWAKTNNSCPQDRTQFLQIFVRKKIKGKIIRIIKVEEAKPDNIPDDDEEPTFCEVCGRCDREDSLLLCDGCDSGHHLECLNPPLSSVPVEEWFCAECQAVNNGRASQEVDIEAGEIVDLLDEVEVPFANRLYRRSNTSAPRRVPRTRASERVIRRITRARTTQPGNNFFDDDEESNCSDSGLDIEVSSSLPSNSSSTVSPCKKKKKLAPKRATKRKVCKRKSTKKGKLKLKRTKRKTKTSTKKKSTKKRKSRKKISKRKTSRRKKKGKGKKKSKIQPIVTPKARLAEALGIKPLKNPWQLSVPAMSGGLSQGDVSLMSQRWRAGVPSLSLLGSNSELDYISEPDEYGDAILVAGVQRRMLTSSSVMARRKAIAANMFCSHAISQSSDDVRLCDKPISDSNISSVSDLLDNIIESQSLLHQVRRPSSDNQESLKTVVEKVNKGGGRNGRQMGLGPNSPTRDGDKNNHSSASGQSRNSNNSQHYFGSNSNNAAENFPNYSFGRAASSRDPTGSKAYSSYLRGYSDDGSGPDRLPPSNVKNDKKGKKEDSRKKGDEEDVNLYSDVEPDFPPCDVDEDDDEEFDKEADPADSKDKDDVEENDPLTSEDELVIDVNDKQDGQQNRRDQHANKHISDSTNNEDEVGSSNLPGLNNFELEAVSDTDTHEMDKSMNSSISLSDSNIGDPEVTSSTHELEVPDFSSIPTPPQIVESYGSRGSQSLLFNHTAIGMGLESLETETISDNEEMCFEDNYENEDNIEEGEIPNENPPSALPTNRPKINIQLKRVIEVSYPNKEFGDGEYEEGEIVDEAAARKKREKAKKEVDEIVNPDQEGEKADLLKENFNPETSSLVTNIAKENASPEKVCIPDLVKEKEKITEKEKNTDDNKLKDKDVSFKKVSRSTKVRNYRENENKEMRSRNRFSRERGHSRDKAHRLSRERDHSRDKDQSREKGNTNSHNRERGHSRDRDKDRNKDRNKDKISERYKGGTGRRKDRSKKREPKRKEMERYNVRQMITKKEEERKKKDEFGRDVSLREIRPSRSRSTSKSKTRKRSISESNKRSKSPTGKKPRQGLMRKSFSRSTSRSRNLNRPKRKRSYSSSSSSSSTSSSSTSSSSYSSSSSSSRTPSRVGQIRDKKRRKSRSKSKSLVKKKVEKKKPVVKPKEKIKKVTVPSPQKKKDEKKKEKRRDKDGIEKEIIVKPDKKKKRKRDKSPLQSKEVYQAGGSIMVSVNFARNIKENKEKKKKKEKDTKIEVEIDKRKNRPEKEASSPYRSWSPGRRSLSSGGKHTPLQDEPMWSPGNIHHVGNRSLEAPKSPELIDLDVILVSPPPQEPILISDSEEEDEGITRLPPDLGIQQLSPISRNQGPKTPPEPAVKFTLSTKQALKPINNPLQDEEEDERAALVASRGPNTPPGPPPESDESVGRPKTPVQRVPHSPAGSPPVSSPEPDVYDPFEPTKSPSPLERSPQQEARVSSSDQIDQIHKSPTKEASPIKIISPPPPPLPSEPPQSEEKPPEPLKKHEDDLLISAPPSSTLLPSISKITPAPISLVVPKQTALPGVVILTTAPPTLTSVTSTAQTPVQQIFAGLPANVASILYPAFEAAALRAPNNLLRSHQVAPIPMLPPDFSRPPPPTAAMLSRPPPTNISPIKTIDKMKTTLNGQNSIPVGDVIDMDLGSPTSPDSSDVSDIFDPPSPHSTHVQEKPSPRKPRPHGPSTGTHKVSPVKSMKSDKFEALFGDARPSKASMAKSKGNFAKTSKQMKPTGKRNDQEDDIPSSAVDLQVKEKLLKKVQRQERVVDEVKLCLKPFYNKKTISKDDYKDIMKKCVQKVCHNRSGEINPNKIKVLVEGYVKKVKYYRKKHVGPMLATSGHSGGLVLPPSVMDPPPPGFGMVAKNLMKLKS